MSIVNTKDLPRERGGDSLARWYIACVLVPVVLRWTPQQIVVLPMVLILIIVLRPSHALA